MKEDLDKLKALAEWALEAQRVLEFYAYRGNYDTTFPSHDAGELAREALASFPTEGE